MPRHNNVIHLAPKGQHHQTSHFIHRIACILSAFSFSLLWKVSTVEWCSSTFFFPFDLRDLAFYPILHNASSMQTSHRHRGSIGAPVFPSITATLRHESVITINLTWRKFEGSAEYPSCISYKPRKISLTAWRNDRRWSVAAVYMLAQLKYASPLVKDVSRI